VAGWVIAEPMSKPNRRAIDRARLLTLTYLEETFPGFQWRMPAEKRQKLGRMPAMEAVELLDAGAAERDRTGWDFAFVITQADLVSHYRARTLATPSQALGVAAVSLARLDPSLGDDGMTEDARVDALARRLTALVLHVFGHLNDLPHAGAEDCYMFPPVGPADLDGFTRYSDESQEALQDALADVADIRLEESRTAPADSLRFYIRSIRHNRREIGHAIMETRFWRFPYHFSRLTTAAASTLLILLVTAEAWDLGMRQRPEVVAVFSLAALVGASLYVLKRQRIFDENWRRGLTERRVISRVSLTAMLLGMSTTYTLLFVSTIAISQIFYPTDLIREWAASLHSPVSWRHFLSLAGFIASLGIIIGALGASFEAQAYFRHVAFVDEET
jgi:predicted Zn-dependent protease